MRTLLSAEEIADRVQQLGARISSDFAGQPLLVVGVLHGSIVLVADLIRSISIPHRVAFVRAASYGAGTRPGPTLTTSTEELPPLAGQHVLLVDDIFDTGRTLARLSTEISTLQPASLKTTVLLWKTARREVDLRPDYYAFEIPDEFVVGYGLDFNGDYRHLPHIAILDPHEIHG